MIGTGRQSRRVRGHARRLAPAGRALVALLAGAILLEGGTAWAAAPEEKAAASRPQSGALAGTFDKLDQGLADFNHAAVLLEQYRYGDAARAFEKVVAAFPQWAAARFNLGVAYLNVQDEASLEKAKQAFGRVLASAPRHLPARFCLGLYYQYTAHDETGWTKALECFEEVRRADPDDPYVGYCCAEALRLLNRPEEVQKLLEKVVAQDPGFVSGIFQLANLYIRRGQREKAMALFERFRALDATELNYGTFVVKQAYGSIGKYYLAVGPQAASGAPPEARPAPRILFSPEVRKLDAALKPWKWAGGTVAVPGVAAGDLDGDGNLDLVVTGVGDDGGTCVFLNRGPAGFVKGPRLADKGVCPCLGDVDNDGDLDLWLGRAGRDLLLLNDGKGNFTAAAAPAVPPDEALTACARLFDVDSDGDLDLLSLRLRSGSIPAASAAPAAGRLFQNNRNGTYEDVAGKLGLALAETPMAAVAYDDFDNDRDLDMVLFPAGKGPIGWVNDRVGQYHLLDAKAMGLQIDGALAATSGDPLKSGNRDLLVSTGKRLELYRNLGPFKFALDKDFSNQHGALGGTGGQFADIDNDGDLDIVIPDAHRRDGSRGPALLVNDWPNRRFLNAADADPGNLLAAIRTEGDAVCVVADFDADAAWDGRNDILLLAMNQPPMLVKNVTRGGHFVALDLVGTRLGGAGGDPAAGGAGGGRRGGSAGRGPAGAGGQKLSTRSANSAIGARVDVKAGTVVQQYVVGGSSAATATPPLRIHAGLGAKSEIEWLRIFWPDAALQAEMQLAANRLFQVQEVNRKPGSCPHLFAWDGCRFAFVSDFGGVGGLGFFLAPGSYVRPDPTEYLPIPQLEPRSGEYVLQVLEPLEEVVYFDEAKLIAVDHPIGTEVYPHEMAAAGAPPPPFELFCVGEPIEPVRAVDHRGIEVTEEIRRVDRRYAGATEPDERFVGYAKDHFVELDFGDRLRGVRPDARLVLFLHGWVEYTYSSTNYAAGQAGLRLVAPSLHVLRSGRWVELAHEAGYPAGLQHVMTLDLTGKLRAGDCRIRIASNMELYWDRIFLAEHRRDARLSVQEVAAEGADLHFFGYPREYSPDGRPPNLLDYSNVDRTMPWKLMKGDYTRYGEVSELVRAADDCYVIMGRGEELSLRFPADAFGPVPAGCRRSFLLKADSYCKDMDLYTAYPDTVEPLPFHAMSGYPYGAGERYPENEKTRACRARYNTRRIGGR